MKLKMATFNIGKIGENPEIYKNMLYEVLKKNRPDVLFLQEYVPTLKVDEGIEKACGLKRAFYKEFCSSHVAVGNRMGVSVFANYEFKDIGEYKLVKPDDVYMYNGNEEKLHDKYFIILEGSFDGRKVRFLTGHSHSFNRYGKKADDYPEFYMPFDEWLTKSGDGADTVIVGDLNIEHAERMLHGVYAEYGDVFDGEATRPTGRKTDYLFVRKDCATEEKVNEQVKNEMAGCMFDHHYLQATVSI